MSTLNAPANVNFALDQSIAQHFKTFTNYMNKQSELHADKVFVRYYFEGRFKELTYADVDCAATNLACKWAKYVQNTKVVSYISDHTVSYIIVMLAVLKLRAVLLVVSPRNSKPAVINLMEKTQSKLIIADVKYESISESVVEQLSDVHLITIPPLDIEALIEEPLNPNYQQFIDLDFTDEDILKPALIIHSSGTTAFPKPVYCSNRYLLYAIGALNILTDSNDNLKKLDTKDISLPLTPLFHLFGIFSCFSVTTIGGSCVFLEKLPASQEDIHTALVANNVTLMSAPPLIFEQIASYLKETKKYSAIQQLKYAICGGAPLRPELYEWFHNNNVNLHTTYGSSESNSLMFSDLSYNSRNWASLRLFHKDSQGLPYGTFEVDDQSNPNIKHLYIHASSPFLGSNVANRADGGYDTQDLFVENSEFPGYYNYIGRRDDTLIMKNGEKTNPVPMEYIIRQSSAMIHQAAIVGHGRQCIAALIELDEKIAQQFTTKEIHASIHAAVAEANRACPSHSKVLPQMVKILPLNRVLPSTDKSTIKRKMAEVIYHDEIEKLYKDFLEGPVTPTVSPNPSTSSSTSSSSLEQIESFLIDSAAHVLEAPHSIFKNHSHSLFDYGLDSITAIQLRNRIAKRFKNVSHDFLFQYYSIESMSKALLNDREREEDTYEQTETQYQKTQQLAEAYIERAKIDFPCASTSSHQSNEKKPKVILLTGVTGSIGSSILRDLLQDPTVEKVYCCVRGEDHQLKDRLIEAMACRVLDVSLLNTARVEVLPMRFSDPFLGFTKERYDQLKQQVTIVQHCAWMLNFNMPIDHFDKECIQPFYNLLKFAYKQTDPMHVYFISSVSASAALAEAEIPEEPLPLDSHVAMPMGYAQSKFVVEVLLSYLTAEQNFPCYIQRLGQVCGDSVHGIWNSSEQYPLMFIGGGSIMHKMPRLDTVIDWISVDYAAAAIVDIMLRTAHLPANIHQSVYHVVNPHHITWVEILAIMKRCGMEFEIVEPIEWVQELAEDESNPAFCLMHFYKRNFSQFYRMPVWKTEKTCALTPILSKSSVIDVDLFTKFLNYWHKIGCYSPSSAL